MSQLLLGYICFNFLFFSGFSSLNSKLSCQTNSYLLTIIIHSFKINWQNALQLLSCRHFFSCNRFLIYGVGCVFIFCFLKMKRYLKTFTPELESILYQMLAQPLLLLLLLLHYSKPCVGLSFSVRGAFANSG